MDQNQTKELIKCGVATRSDFTPWQSIAICSNPQARAFVPIELAQKLTVLPLMVTKTPHGEVLTALIREEYTPEDIKTLSFVSGMALQVDTCNRELLSRAITSAYLCDNEQISIIAKKALQQTPSIKEEVSYESNDPIPELLSAIIERAIANNVSDVHVEPAAMRYRTRMRKDGELYEENELCFTNSVATALCRRIKVLARLDSAHSKKVQEGSFTFNRNGCEIRIRVSIVPMLQGEKIVLRLLDNYFLSSLKIEGKTEQCFNLMGLDSEQELMLKAQLDKGRGSIIVSGATGSGKSTLLYGCLEYLNNGTLNITSLEDPVERIIAGINQAEVEQKKGQGYQEALSNILRQDPDVVMIGEIRDQETATTALTAGITGHLVLSTVHAGNCLEALLRLLELKVEPKLISISLSMLISQKLVKKNCPHCLDYQIASTELISIFHLSSNIKLAESRGCEKCNYSGCCGRQGIFEILFLTDQLRELVFCLSKNHEKEFLQGFRKTMSTTKYKPFALRIRELMLRGEISPRTAFKTLGFMPVS